MGALNDGNGDVIISDAERANLLNDYFSSVCTTNNGIMPVIERSVPDNVELDFIEFKPDKVCAAIKKRRLAVLAVQTVIRRCCLREYKIIL